MHPDSDFWQQIDQLLDAATAEDIGSGDATSQALLAPGESCAGTFAARSPGVMAGFEIVERFYRRLDPEVRLEAEVAEGHSFPAGATLACIHGPAIAVLSGERTALNILQRMCGVASVTRRYVQAVEGTKAKICDTRKTIPGWRALDKLAVYLGGGTNHRRGLYDMILIKDNHILLAGRQNAEASAAWAVQTARARSELKIEVEVESLDELEQVLSAEPDLILLDNMDEDDLRLAVKIVNRRCQAETLRRPLLEASGGIELGTVRRVAETGVDRISVGALTHSAPALDIGLDLSEP